jgi:tRNA modification GTPase
VDASEPWTDEDANLLGKVLPLGPLLVAANKSDLPARLSPSELQPRLALDSNQAEIVRTSALTGDGLPELKEKILRVTAPAHDLGGEFITNLRHQQLLQDSLRALARARQAAEQHTPHEMLLLDLYDALRPLDSITGATYIDDLLGIIFSKFCVGK